MSTTALASIEADLLVPAARVAIGHTNSRCRVMGRIRNSRSAAPVIRVTLGGRVLFEQPVLLDDRAEADGTWVGTFDVYVDLPRVFATHRLRVEVDDGTSSARSDRRLGRRTVPLRNDTYVGHAATARRAFIDRNRSLLRGRGVEFGALHMPLDLHRDDCEVVYADRLTKREALERFPELAAHADQVVEVSVVVDLDRDDLGALRSEDFDFFVANDVIEHLANPLRFLEGVHSAMKPGAVLLLAVPDRDYTFDARRSLTPWSHLWEEYERDVTSVSDEHVVEFLKRTKHPRLPPRAQSRKALIELHRERSVHVHVWDERSFDAFLERAGQALHLDWEVVERLGSREGGGGMVYVLRRGSPVGQGEAAPAL
jgi:SAM-dependent methyltransferase